MKSIFLTAFSLFAVLTASAQKTPADYVNPFIGTSNFGATQPGPVVPYGMVSMSPFNTIEKPGHTIHVNGGWCSTPFVYENKFIAGFTNVNLSGVGCPDFGSLLLMPTTGELEVDYNKYCSEIENQVAKAGYYSADITKYNVKAEMTATERTTLSKYTFPAGQSNILLNIGLGLTNETGGTARIVSDREIEGYKLMGTFCYTKSQSIIPIYFVVRVNKPAEIKYWKKQDLLIGGRHDWDPYSGKYKVYTEYNREMAGDEIGVAFSFNTQDKEAIEVSVGVSYVSIENARENLNKEQHNTNFDKISAQAIESWNNVLSNVEVEGGTEDDKSIFYTALYHTYIHPNILQDVNGEYPAMSSGKTLKVNHNRFTMFSGWDVYRINPALMSLVCPQRGNDMVKSLYEMYEESGNLPKFEIASQEFHVMQGDPAIPYIVDLYMRGMLNDMEAEELYEAMYKNAFTEGANNVVRPDNDFYAENGYLPILKPYDNTVSQALEYYIADWSLAQMAKKLGKTADYETLMTRSMGYKKYFDPTYCLLRPINPDGTFMEGFDPLQGENFAPVHGFHEGTSWNYSFYLPHDILGLIKLHGGNKKFTANLQKCFDEGLFDMTNEPDMGYPYYFSYIKGEEWRTQKMVRELLKKWYKNAPVGIPGNDDTGTMSAWGVFSLMGLYPPTPGEPNYIISSPTFDKITIKLDPKYYKNSELVIKGLNASDENIYIKSIKVGGKKYNSRFITHDALVNAGEIVIECTNQK
ncbi:MAG: GH92 family glycosyl hydrolase [Rikenellaceae bacterium]